MASIRARHNYNSCAPDELSFKKKDVLTLVDKMGNKGWWKARAPSGKEGLVPANYFDPPEVTKEESDAFDAQVSWSQTSLPKIAPVSDKRGAATTAAAVAPPAPSTNTAASLLPAASAEPDSFGLDAWAKEMEALLLSTPTGSASKKSAREAEKPAPVKTGGSPVATRAASPGPVRATPAAVKEVVPVAAVAASTPAPIATPAPAPVASSPAAKPAEAAVDNSEWIVWMQRALTAEQNINDLIKAAESDRIEFEKKLEESNRRAITFEEQVSRMIDKIKDEKQQLETRHKQELSEAQSRAAASGVSSDGKVEQLERQLAQERLAKEELMSSVEADVQQFTQLLEEERRKHCESVARATEFSVKLEEALDRVVEIETSLEEKCEELRDAQAEHARQLAMERAQREALEKKLSEKAVASASASSDKQRVAELENQLLIEKHLKDALLLENQFLKSQAEKAKQQRPVSIRGEPVVVQAPPTVPREAEILLQTKKPVAGATGSGDSSSAAVSQMSQELMRQRVLRSKGEEGKASKVNAVVNRISQDFSKTGSGVSNSPAPSSSPASSTAAPDGSPAPVSRSRANEILLRAKALAEKAKKDTQSGSDAK